MNIIEVKYKCDWSSDTALYLQSGINVLCACHFTYSPKTQQEHNIRKSLIISYRVDALQLNSHIVVSQKFKLKLISAKFLLPMISRNELYITLSTLCRYSPKQWMNYLMNLTYTYNPSTTPSGGGMKFNFKIIINTCENG